MIANIAFKAIHLWSIYPIIRIHWGVLDEECEYLEYFSLLVLSFHPL